jgi:hypothetical protein
MSHTRCTELTVRHVYRQRIGKRMTRSARKHGAIRHPDIRMKHCVTTLLNPRGVTTVSHKYNLTAARHAIVVVAVPSTVHHLANYKIKYII